MVIYNDMEDDDVPCLSAETFAALQEFYKEQEQQQSIANSLKDNENVVANFEEDWQLSQFWYDDNTTDTLVDIAFKTIGSNGKIALISCPTLYKKMKEKAGDSCEVTVYEYDQRFAAFGEDFVLYDYKLPLSVPRDKGSYYDLVIADPPFLSEECLSKTAVTMKFLAKDKMVLCTGAVMADLAKRLLNLKKATFEPHHKNNLANEFWCFSNYDVDSILL